MSFLAIWKVLNFDCSKFEQLSSPKFTKFQSSESKIAKKDIFGLFEFAKIWFYTNWSGGEINKFPQSQALTSHFESFWSIVHTKQYFALTLNSWDQFTSKLSKVPIASIKNLYHIRRNAKEPEHYSRYGQIHGINVPWSSIIRSAWILKIKLVIGKMDISILEP